MVQRMLPVATGMVINLIVLNFFVHPLMNINFCYYLSGMVGVLMKHVRIFFIVHYLAFILTLLPQNKTSMVHYNVAYFPFSFRFSALLSPI